MEVLTASAEGLWEAFGQSAISGCGGGYGVSTFFSILLFPFRLWWSPEGPASKESPKKATSSSEAVTWELGVSNRSLVSGFWLVATTSPAPGSLVKLPPRFWLLGLPPRVGLLAPWAGAGGSGSGDGGDSVGDGSGGCPGGACLGGDAG